MLTLIVARAQNGAIGKDGTIPWHAPEDLAFFQRETTGGAVIMGRRTWESLPYKPLKNRLNLVISSKLDAQVDVFGDICDAVSAAYQQGYRRIYGIGGAGIYQGLLPKADRLLVTEVAMDVEGADAFFPEFSEAVWALKGRHLLRPEAPPCTVYEYLRR